MKHIFNNFNHFCQESHFCSNNKCISQSFCCDQCKNQNHSNHIIDIKDITAFRLENQQKKEIIKQAQICFDDSVSELNTYFDIGQSSLRSLLQTTNPCGDSLNIKKKFQDFNEKLDQFTNTNNFKSWLKEFQETQLEQLSFSTEQGYEYYERNDSNRLNDTQKVILQSMDTQTKDYSYVNEKLQQLSLKQSKLEKKDWTDYNQSKDVHRYIDNYDIQKENKCGMEKNELNSSKKVNEFYTPTSDGEDDGDLKIFDLKNILQDNQNELNRNNQQKQRKQRYTDNKKLEILKELYSRPEYQNKKKIAPDFLLKYEICYQTIVNWQKKFEQK